VSPSAPALELPHRPPGGGPAPIALDVNGAPAAVRRQGIGEPVLFLHGSHFGGMWLPFHTRLAATFDLLAPELPGFPEAAVPDWVQGFDDLVLHYRALLDALELESVHVVGHALGGWVAADLAVFYPERVRSLSLLAPAGLRVPGHPMAEYLGMAPERVAQLLFNGDPGEHAGLLPDATDAEAFARNYGETGVTVRLIWERRYDLRLERRLPNVRIPTLVVQGEDDRLIPNVHAARWAELLPEAHLETIPGTGHAFFVQAPDATAEVVTDFISRAEQERVTT